MKNHYQVFNNTKKKCNKKHFLTREQQYNYKKNCRATDQKVETATRHLPTPCLILLLIPWYYLTCLCFVRYLGPVIGMELEAARFDLAIHARLVLVGEGGVAAEQDVDDNTHAPHVHRLLSSSLMSLSSSSSLLSARREAKSMHVRNMNVS